MCGLKNYALGTGKASQSLDKRRTALKPKPHYVRICHAKGARKVIKVEPVATMILPGNIIECQENARWSAAPWIP